MRRFEPYLYLEFQQSCVFFQLFLSSSKPAVNMHRSIELLQSLPDHLQVIIRPVIARNAYWCHPEAMLLSMCADDDPDVRERAVGKIMECRRTAEEVGKRSLRAFDIPDIFSAPHYSDVFDWARVCVTEPPLTKHMSDNDILAVVAVPLPPLHYPVHTQAVEFVVQEVTKACIAVVGEEARHNYICARMRHRKALPVFESKRHVYS